MANAVGATLAAWATIVHCSAAESAPPIPDVPEGPPIELCPLEPCPAEPCAIESDPVEVGTPPYAEEGEPDEDDPIPVGPGIVGPSMHTNVPIMRSFELSGG
jgi:hypothetical protein